MWANGWTGDLYIALPLFMAQLTAFSYVLSFLFSTPRSALSYTPAVVVGLWLLPGFLTILFILLLASYLGNVDLIYCITYGLACGTPFGSLFVIFLDTQTDGSLDEYPGAVEVMLIMVGETILFLIFAMIYDRGGRKPLSFQPQETSTNTTHI